ncbi:MFS transporter [Pectobacterium colocasium]|nr:MFS transporter [Pectobacterium colocasium]UYA58823.1 putative MFS-type transporter [Pectobacterium sp. F1-1]
MVFLTPVIVYQLTGSIEYSGLSYALWWLPRILIIPLIGKYIDQLGVRPLSISSDLIKSTGCLFLAITDFSSDLSIAIAFGIVGSLISIGNSQTIISYEKLVSLLSKRKEHHANLISRMDFMGMIIGPLMGILLIDHGFRMLLIIPCILYITNAAFFFLEKGKLNETKISALSENVTPYEESGFKKSIIYLFSIPALLFSIFLAIGNNMFDGLVESSGAALIERSMDLPVKYFGLIDVAAGICGVLGTYFYSHFKRVVSRKNLLLLSVIFITINSILLIIFKSSFTAFIFCYALSIMGKVFTGNICRMIRIELIEPTIFASTSSLIVLFNQSILPLVGMLLYISGDSVRAVYFLMATAITITFLAGVFLYRKITSAVVTPDIPRAI